MEIFWIILGIFVLYIRTLNYHYMIDDNVRRWGYLYIVPEISPPASFYHSKPSKWRHLWLIITHAMNTYVINLIWGWKIALLFAFHPLSVVCTAWITGGYYSLTTFFVLISYYFITNYHLLGGLLGSFFFTAALGSTITCIGFPFIFLFQEHQGLLCFWPLLTYLFGKRFITGFGIRNSGKKDTITFRKLAVIPKVVAYYILIALVPNQLAFFRQFGFGLAPNTKVKKDVESFNFEFYISVVLCAAFAITSYLISPFGMFWFFCMILPFSQFKQLGQFVAERYSYLPNIGICIILGTLIESQPYILTILTTLYIYRSHLYIPAYRHMEDLYKDGMKNYPDSVANYANLAEVYLQSGRSMQAYQIIEEGFKRDPNCFLLHCNVAAYWIGVNNLERGLSHSRTAVEIYKDQESNAVNIMKKQCDDIQRIINERNIEYARLDAESATEADYEAVKMKAVKEAQELTKRDYALAT